MARKELGHAVNESFLGNTENFRKILLNINDGVYLVDRERRIIFWNRACEEITGYAAAEVLGRPCSENILNHTDHEGNSLCESELCPLYRSMVTGVASEEPITVLALRRNGSRLAVEVSVAPLRDEHDVVIGGVEVFRDITNRRELEEAKARFLSGVTHELKTPVAVIQGYMEMMIDGDSGEINQTQASFLADSMAEAKRLEKMINDLLDLARCEATEFSVNFQVVDLEKIARRVVKGFAAEADKKSLEMEMRASPVQLFGDPDRIHQALANLVSNAIKYTDAGKICVEAAAEGGWAVVKVSDTGVGMKEEELQRIFEPFYRVDEQKPRLVEGSGIGLSVVRRIVESHGGEMDVKSRPGEGSVFSISLPLTPLDKARTSQEGEEA